MSLLSTSLPHLSPQELQMPTITSVIRGWNSAHETCATSSFTCWASPQPSGDKFKYLNCLLYVCVSLGCGPYSIIFKAHPSFVSYNPKDPLRCKIPCKTYRPRTWLVCLSVNFQPLPPCSQRVTSMSLLESDRHDVVQALQVFPWLSFAELRM